jgi:F-type H+-transporting ATPase subunit delta
VEEIAQVYARSLFAVAKEQDKLDVVREQLGVLADALDGQQELRVFLFSPYFSTEEKKDGLGRVVQGAEPIVQNFLELLVEKHRMPALFRIRRAYDAMWEDEHQLLPVQITSAIELDEATVRSIGDRIGQQTGRRVELTARVDPDVLGGLVLQVGNQILDASIRTRLDNLRKNVAAGR